MTPIEDLDRSRRSDRVDVLEGRVRAVRSALEARARGRALVVAATGLVAALASLALTAQQARLDDDLRLGGDRSALLASNGGVATFWGVALPVVVALAVVGCARRDLTAVELPRLALVPTGVAVLVGLLVSAAPAGAKATLWSGSWPLAAGAAPWLLLLGSTTAFFALVAASRLRDAEWALPLGPSLSRSGLIGTERRAEDVPAVEALRRAAPEPTRDPDDDVDR